MSYDRYHRVHRTGNRFAADAAPDPPRAVGKTTLVAQLEAGLSPPVQRRPRASSAECEIHSIVNTETAAS